MTGRERLDRHRFVGRRAERRVPVRCCRNSDWSTKQLRTILVRLGPMNGIRSRPIFGRERVRVRMNGRGTRLAAAARREPDAHPVVALHLRDGRAHFEIGLEERQNQVFAFVRQRLVATEMDLLLQLISNEFTNVGIVERH
jgi:hypothetical protein